MTYINVRHTVADYEKWRPFFDGDQARRIASGATGVYQVYRDADNPNVITLFLEWDNPANAAKFLHDPALGAAMAAGGVVGAPAVVAILTRA